MSNRIKGRWWYGHWGVTVETEDYETVVTASYPVNASGPVESPYTIGACLGQAVAELLGDTPGATRARNRTV